MTAMQQLPIMPLNSAELEEAKTKLVAKLNEEAAAERQRDKAALRHKKAILKSVQKLGLPELEKTVRRLKAERVALAMEIAEQALWVKHKE